MGPRLTSASIWNVIGHGMAVVLLQHLGEKRIIYNSHSLKGYQRVVETRLYELKFQTEKRPS